MLNLKITTYNGSQLHNTRTYNEVLPTTQSKLG